MQGDDEDSEEEVEGLPADVDVGTPSYGLVHSSNKKRKVMLFSTQSQLNTQIGKNHCIESFSSLDIQAQATLADMHA